MIIGKRQEVKEFGRQTSDISYQKKVVSRTQ
jgi:hypothetical protein